MGRRAAVIEKGRDAKRRPVVVREGPPQVDKRRITDLVFGVLGAALLILAIILVPLLPEDEPVPEQYQVTYAANSIDEPGAGDLDFQEGESQSITFAYDGQYLYRLEVAVEWTDDLAESLPDTFSITLTDPQGNVRFGPQVFANPHPEPQGSALAPTYVAQPESRIIPVDIAPRPTTQVITAEDGDDLASVTARVGSDATTNGTGEWTLAVTLVEAGDCPPPQSLDPNRVFACQAASGGAPDDGNPFQVARVSYIEYLPTVTLLEP